jgi:large subunit ribosomal protein L9
MNVILLDNVENLGGIGDLVSVKAGYGRNYLLPQGKAALATKDNIAEFEARRTDLEKSAAADLAGARAREELIQGMELVITANAGTEGKLFGSISDADIATAITKFTGIDVDRKLVSLDAPIKEIGLHEVALRPHPEVEFIVTLDVIPA